MQRYNPKEIEPKWQSQWQKNGIYNAVDFDKERQKYVVLTEFPYPSGEGIHIGHTREYTLGDVIARHKRMQGMNVLYPMGYDAFGLPTENYAIKNKISPQEATDKNISTFQKQLESLGFSIDWNRSFRTSDPDYYRWTQWLFLQFFKAGLAYQDEIAINWCPFCKTGLANEEVVNGRHERCDTPVEKRTLKQWLLKITKYADRLINGLSDVDYLPRIAEQQVNWIGRSTGAEIQFSIQDSDEVVTVFTTRPDTIYGATFLVLAPEHPLSSKIVPESHKDQVNSYVHAVQSKTDIERQDTSHKKTGVSAGVFAINPATKKPIPIWIADYVLPNYGSGAIMAVPAHDERDNEFAGVYNLPIIKVIQAENSGTDSLYTGEGILINSGPYNDLSSSDAREKIIADLSEEGIAKERVNYRLRDWIFSRQHYWGEPIPIIHCEEHGPVPVPDDQLPVTLPPVDHYTPTDTGESPLAIIADWVNVPCPICGKSAKRETDTMPNWAGSSWYYLRYFDSHNDNEFVGSDKLEYWQNVDIYLGGMEHTTLHLLYSRFWHQFLYDQKLVPTPEPYKIRRGQGIILAADGTKMSKSKGNVVNPSEVIDSGYGADALRVAIAFIAPYDQTTPWSPEGVAGTFRFLQRMWVLTQEFIEVKKSPETTTDNAELEPLRQIVHQTIKKVSQDVEVMNFNTAVAALMEGLNVLYKLKVEHPMVQFSNDWKWGLEMFLKLIAPFAPHLTEELWHQLGNEDSIHVSSWPIYDERYLVSDSVTIVIQVNGKLRSEIIVPVNVSETEIITKAQNDPKISSYIKDLEVVRTIYVPNKLVNFVVNQ